MKIAIGAFSIFLWETIYTESRVASVGLSMSGRQSDPASLGLIASMVFLIAGICCLICAGQKELDVIFHIVTAAGYFLAGVLCLSADSSVYEDLKVFGWMGIIIFAVFLVVLFFSVRVALNKVYVTQEAKELKSQTITKEVEVVEEASKEKNKEEKPIEEVSEKSSEEGN